jgi:hypothetical protein
MVHKSHPQARINPDLSGGTLHDTIGHHETLTSHRGGQWASSYLAGHRGTALEPRRRIGGSAPITPRIIHNTEKSFHFGLDI